MAVTLPNDNQKWPAFRLLVLENFSGSTSSSVGFKKILMENPSADMRPGYILINYSRALLPQLGRAEIVYRYGRFGERIEGLSKASKASIEAGNPWDPSTDSLDLPTLKNLEILIQANYEDPYGTLYEDNWKTVFWGTCEYEIDQPWGGADVPSGEITFHLVDAFHRTSRWYLNRHGYYAGGAGKDPVPGHPGYNVSPQTPGQAAGNKYTGSGKEWNPTTDTGVQGNRFSLPGAGEKWTDAEVFADAQAISRPSGQPFWTLAGATDLLSEKGPWPVDFNESFLSLCNRIFSRNRGMGAALPDWDQSTPTSAIQPKLRVFAQLKDAVSYTNPSSDGGGAVNLNGALLNGTTVSVDLIGDHRLVPGSLKLGDAEQYRTDYLEIVGEPIEVMATVEYTTTLEKGWKSADETTFNALPAEEQRNERWKPVFCLHRLTRTFNMTVGNGNGGSTVNADYRCDDRGNITTTVGPYGGSALSAIQVLDDLPLYVGYTINGGTLARDDAQSASTYDGTPQRRPPLNLIRDDSANATDDTFYTDKQLGFSLQVKQHPDGFYWQVAEDDRDGGRRIGSIDNLSSDYDYDWVVMTLGFRLPHRVRMAFGDYEKPRHKIIYIRDAHLWIAAPNAIYDLDYTGLDPLEPGVAKRAGAQTILRDDRGVIARVAALAVLWYGPAKDVLGEDYPVVHRGAEWTLRACGDIESATDYDGGGVVYPTCGQVVEYITANGQLYFINSPVSSVIYDNRSGQTTWTCDWQDLDFGRR